MSVQDQLTALARADRVEIVTSRRTVDVAATVTLREPTRIASLLALLVPSYYPPSGGMRAATLAFYAGSDRLAELWIYHNGPWGFIGGDGTVGRSTELMPFILEQVERGSDT